MFITVLGMRIRSLALSGLVFSTLIGCGGGGSGASSTPSSDILTWKKGIFANQTAFESLCVTPRPGTNDRAGSTQHEKMWLRSWTNNTYLWYREIDDIDPTPLTVTNYFNKLKTTEQTSSGNAKDNFHFSTSTEEWKKRTNSGISLGYGAKFQIIKSTPPRNVTIAYVEPNSPAQKLGLMRGDRITTINGVDLINSSSQNDIDLINSAIFPKSPQNEFNFQFTRENSQDISVSMKPTSLKSTPVQNVITINTDNGTVGYFQFNAHIKTSEKQLKEAIDTIKSQNVDDLVVDLRYNGGGLLDVANELAYMVAGQDKSKDKIFSKQQFNDQHPNTNPVTGRPLSPFGFHRTSQGFSLGAGQPLPSLNLKRVFVLATASTCSASEAFINGLRGIDVEVILIGTKTCGKPYGFYPTDNCGTTYFSIQFRSVNDKDFGDYSDGFEPSDRSVINGTQIKGCSVADDFSHQLGDKNEAMLNAALVYQATGKCPIQAGSTTATVSLQGYRQSKAEKALAIGPSKNSLDWFIENNNIITPQQ
ncbi:MAG: S41 family peptidase [Parashewanella sp.]